MAKVFSQVGKRTPVTARFSTIAGNLGSPDAVRDLRGLGFKYVLLCQSSAVC
jgi:catalase